MIITIGENLRIVKTGFNIGIEQKREMKEGKDKGKILWVEFPNYSTRSIENDINKVCDIKQENETDETYKAYEEKIVKLMQEILKKIKVEGGN